MNLGVRHHEKEERQGVALLEKVRTLSAQEARQIAGGDHSHMSYKTICPTPDPLVHCPDT